MFEDSFMTLMLGGIGDRRRRGRQRMRWLDGVTGPVLGTGRDIKRYPAFPNWMIYFQVSTRPGIKLLVALRLLTTQGAQASAAGTHTHRGS